MLSYSKTVRCNGQIEKKYQTYILQTIIRPNIKSTHVFVPLPPHKTRNLMALKTFKEIIES